MNSESKIFRRNTIFPGSDEQDQLDQLELPRHHGSRSDESRRVAEVPAKRTRTIVKGGADSGLLDLRLPLKHNNKRSSWIDASPWSFYERAYRIELGGPVAVVYKLDAGDQYILNSISAPDDQIRLLCRLSHENLVQIYEVFRFKDVLYTISEHMAISLNHFIGCDKLLNEAQVATISSQVSHDAKFVKHILTSTVP